MKKKDVLKWCKENNHVLIDIKRKEIPLKFVLEVAKNATCIDSIDKQTQQPEYSFARFLAIKYLDTKYSTGKIAKLFRVHHSIISHARNLLNNVGVWDDYEKELRFFKNWQKESIIYFNEKIRELERIYSK